MVAPVAHNPNLNMAASGCTCGACFRHVCANLRQAEEVTTQLRRTAIDTVARAFHVHKREVVWALTQERS